MERGERGREIERLRDATAEIAPDDGLTDAVMAAIALARTDAEPAAESGQSARDPLAEIAERTSAIEPGDGLTDAVMERVGSGVAPFLGRAQQNTGGRGAAIRKPATWQDGVVRAGPLAVGLAAALAAACFALFLSSQSSLDASVASAFDAVEVTE